MTSIFAEFAEMIVRFLHKSDEKSGGYIGRKEKHDCFSGS